MIGSPGIHHITATCGSPRLAIDFCARVLGLRLVKRTVNFDDTASWHLYFGDELGLPGSLLTFFARPGEAQGSPGAGEVVSISLAIPLNATAFWIDRLSDEGVRFGVAEGGRALAFHAPWGLALELVETVGAADMPGYESETMSGEFAPRGIASATMLVGQIAATARLMSRGLGWRESGRASHGDFTRLRFEAPGRPVLGGVIDLLTSPGLTAGTHGVGSVHHIAFRAPDSAGQAELAAGLRSLGFKPTDMRDRKYFRSIYFREPSGVLFEIATDGPGFLVDESLAKLGTGIMLPPDLEARRAEIVAGLPELA